MTSPEQAIAPQDDQRTRYDAGPRDVAPDTDEQRIGHIPAQPGMSFRGGVADWWEVGGTYTEPGWLHTSRDPHVATDNFADHDVVVLFGAGRDLLGHTEHPEDQETVFLPGTRFTVVHRGSVGELWVTIVVVAREGQDGPPSVDVEDAARRAAAVLERARILPPVVLSRPGRYRGPFGSPDGA